jgi:hypothetical protein
MKLGRDAVDLQRHLCELSFLMIWSAHFARVSTRRCFLLSSTGPAIKSMSFTRTCPPKGIHGRSEQQLIRIAWRKYSAPAYWEAVDQIHKVSSDVGGPERTLAKANEEIDAIVLGIAKQRQLDGSAMDACVAKQDGSVIKRSQVEAETLGVVRTPTLFINGAKIEGAVPLPFLFQMIDVALRSQGIQPPVAITK